MTVLRSLLERRNAEDPRYPLTSTELVKLLDGSPVEAGVSVNPESAMGLTAVYRAQALLAGLIGALPLHSYRKSGSSREPVASAAIDNPHPDMSPYELWEFVGFSLLSWGNAYLYKRRDGLGRVRELLPFHPSAMRVERKREWQSTQRNPTGKRFIEQTSTGENVFDPFDVLHIPGFSYDGVVGMSPISVARQSLGRSLAVERFGARMFGRGALIDGVLQSDKEVGEPLAKRLQEQWRQKASGPDRQWDIPVLHSGLKFERIGLPPQDAQFIETMRYGVRDVACLYGLPPHLLADVERSTSWGTGIEQQNLQMLVYTLDPLLVRIEQRVTREVVLDSTQYVKFNRGALLRSDMATRYMAHYRALTGGWENADEIRGLEERDPLPNGMGQTFYRPSNIVPVGEEEDPEPVPPAEPEEPEV